MESEKEREEEVRGKEGRKEKIVRRVGKRTGEIKERKESE